MPALFASNPLYDRLTRDARGPSVRACLWLACGLGLVALTVMSWGMLYQPDSEFLLPTIILIWVAGLLTLLSPILLGAIAATSTVNDVQSEEYSSLPLTSLSSGIIVRGYIGAALHRMRLLLALVIGMMPILVVGMLWSGIWFAAFLATLMCREPTCAPPVLPASEIESLYWGSYGLLAWVITLWGANLFGAVIGVWLGLVLRRLALAAMMSVFIVLLVLIGVYMLIGRLSSMISNPFEAFSVSLMFVPTPYVLGWIIARLAQRWV